MPPHAIDDTVSLDKQYYDQVAVGFGQEYQTWMREIEFYFNSYAGTLESALRETDGRVAELGAGSCGLSACLSRIATVTQVYAVDISVARMQKMAALSFELLGGNRGKLELIAADFNARLPFDDASLDLIVFDAALHHSRSIWHTLSECHRVLTSKGIVIAQREAYLNPMRAGRQLGRLLQSPEVAARVSENMYLKEQYEYYLKTNGFNPSFIKATPNKLKSRLSFLNGTLFCDGVIWCHKC